MPTNSLQSSGLVAPSASLVQTRVASLEKGVPGFRITSYLSSPGCLPDTGAFVLEIVDTENPDADALVRVASIADFMTFPSLRSEAVRGGLQYYRSPSWSVFYTDVTFALAAATNFKDRVNQLIQDWMTYVYQFQAGPPGDVTVLPTEDLSALAGLIATWESARQSTASAQDAVTTAQSNLTAAEASLASATSMASFVTDLQPALVSLYNQSSKLWEWVTILREAKAHYGTESVPFPATTQSFGNTIWQAVSDLVLAVDNDTTSTQSSLLLAARDAFVNRTGVPQLETVYALLFGPGGLPALEAAYADQGSSGVLPAQRIVQAETRVMQVLAAKTAAQAAVDAANVALATAKAASNVASLSEQAALNAVISACPTFDPNNPSASLPA